MSTLVVKFRSRHQYGPNLFTDSYPIDKQITVSTSTNIVTESGLTYDGKFLWFCTFGSPVGPRPARLVQVDPVSGQQIKNITCTGHPNGESILDIVHYKNDENHQWGFFALCYDEGTGLYRVRYISKLGFVLRSSAAFAGGGDPAVSWRAIASDGFFLYLTRYRADFGTYGYTNIEVWNPVTLSKERDLALAGVFPMYSNEGWGIVHTGFQIVSHSDSYSASHIFMDYVPSLASAPSAGRASARTVFKEARTDPHRSPLTFNRFHVIHFHLVEGGD